MGHSGSESGKHLGFQVCGQLIVQSSLNEKDKPLVIAVLAHKVYTGQIKLSAARCTLCDLENFWLRHVAPIQDSFALGSSFRTIRVVKVFVLKSL